MSVYLKVIHKGKLKELSLAQAADLIGMAKSTFSANWRRLYDGDDQATFDYIVANKRPYSKCTNSNKMRTVKAIERNEAQLVIANSHLWRLFNFERAEIPS